MKWGFRPTFQLAARLPDYRKLLLALPETAELDRKDGAGLFDYLLAEPLRSVINGCQGEKRLPAEPRVEMFSLPKGSTYA